MTSIRRTLSLSLLSIGLVTGLVTAALSFWAATDEAEELFDAQMAQMARLTGQLAPAGPLTHFKTPAEFEWTPAHPYEKQLSYRIVDASGTVLIASPSFPKQIDARQVPPAAIAIWMSTAPSGDCSPLPNPLVNATYRFLRTIACVVSWALKLPCPIPCLF